MSKAKLDTKQREFDLELLKAVTWQDQEEVEELLQLGANAEFTCNDYGHNTAVQLATIAGNIEILKILLGYSWDVNKKNLDGKVALGMAIELGNINTVKTLVEGGADINLMQDINPTSPSYNLLSLAVSYHQYEIVKYLLENGANVNLRNATNSNCTSLHIAAKNNNLELMRLLINNGADVDAQDNHGHTVLFYLLSYHKSLSIPAIKLLIDNGAKIDLADNNGEQPLGLLPKHLENETNEYYNNFHNNFPQAQSEILTLAMLRHKKSEDPEEPNHMNDLPSHVMKNILRFVALNHFADIDHVMRVKFCGKKEINKVYSPKPNAFLSITDKTIPVKRNKPETEETKKKSHCERLKDKFHHKHKEQPHHISDEEKAPIPLRKRHKRKTEIDDTGELNITRAAKANAESNAKKKEARSKSDSHTDSKKKKHTEHRKD